MAATRANEIGSGSTAQQVRASLAAVMHDLQSSKDKKKCMESLLQLLTSVVEKGQCLMDAFHQHVCCNVLALVIQNFMSPSLMKSRSPATLRSDVTRPFVSILELLHKHIPSAFLHQPLLWKEARPLHMLFKHVAEVLEGRTTASLQCAQDYAAVVVLLLNVDIYRASISRHAVESLTTRLVELAHDATVAPPATAEALSEAAVEQITAAIASLAGCPHFYASLKAPADTMKRLADVAVARHKDVSPTLPLRVQMHLLTALRRFADSCLHDNKACAAHPWRLVKVLTASWHMTNRRDGWRLEALQLATQQVALAFSDLIHQSVQQSSCSETPAETSALCPPHLATYVEAVHRDVLPAVLSILSAPKCEFSVVSSRELSHAPCPKLQALFDFSALVLFIAQRTYRWYADHQLQDPRDAEDANPNLTMLGDENGAARKKRRCAASPWDDIMSHITALTSLAAHDVQAFAFRRDTCCLWLHTLAVPIACLLFDELQATRLVETLQQFILVGGAHMEQPLLHALSVLAPHASLATRISVYSWVATKHINCTGVEVDDGAPSARAYDLMCRLTESVLLQSVEHSLNTLSHGDNTADPLGAAWQARSSFLRTAAQLKSFHFSITAAEKHYCGPLLTFVVRQAQLRFVSVTEIPLHLEVVGLVRNLAAVAASHTFCDNNNNIDEDSHSISSILALISEISILCHSFSLRKLQQQGNPPVAAEEWLQKASFQLSQHLQETIRRWRTALPDAVERVILSERVLDDDRAIGDVLPPHSLAFDSLIQDLRQSVLGSATEFAEGVAGEWEVGVARLVTEVTKRLNSAASRADGPAPSLTVENATGTQEKSRVAAHALQLATVTLHLKHCGLWAPAHLEDDGSRYAEAVAANRRDVESIAKLLPPQGLILHNLQELLEVAASSMASRTLPFGHCWEDASMLSQLAELFVKFGKDLCSVDIALWEPSQGMLSSIGLIGRKLLELGVLPLHKHAEAPSATADLMAAMSEEALSLRARVVRALCRALCGLYTTLQSSDIYVSSSDPLIQASHVLKLLVPLLQSPRLQLCSAADASADESASHESSKPMLSILLMECAGHLLSVLSVLQSDAAHQIVVEAAKTLSTNFAYSHTDACLSVLTSLGSDQSPSWSASTRSRVGSLLEQFANTLRDNDQSGSLALQPTPPMSPQRQTALAQAIAQVLSRCDTSQAERLTKIFFSFTGMRSCFAVRLSCARCIATPFRMFTRVSSVLQELQYHSKDPIISKERSTCATALLALCNAANAAAQLEADVVSFFVECYATRDFLHKPLIFRALQRIAATALREGNTERSPTYAELSRHHVGRLVYDWLWRFGHPLEALPVACFGFETLHEMATVYCDVMLPVALLHLKQTQNASLSGGTANAAVSLFQLFSGSSSDSGRPNLGVDTTALLREHLSPLVATLLLFSGAAAASPTSKPHQELSDAAAYALEWVTLQIGRQLFVDMCKKRCDTVISLMLRVTGRGCGATLLATTVDEDGGVTSKDSSSASAALVSLPSVSFSAATKALTQLCQLVEASTFRQLFSAYHGDRACFLVWDMYHQYQHVAGTPVAQWDVLLLLEQVLQGWFTPVVLVLPHVLEAVVHVVCHIIGDSSHSCASRFLVCNMLRFVWRAAAADSSHSRALLKPHTALVSSTLLALSSQSQEIKKLWKDLCDVDPSLQRNDWHQQQSQLVSAMSQERLLDDDDDDESASPTKPGSRKQHRPRGTVIQALRDLTQLAGTPSATFYSDLAAAVDAEADQLAAGIVSGASGDEVAAGVAALRDALLFLYRVSSSHSDIALDTRIAAVGALRSVYDATLRTRAAVEEQAYNASGGVGAAFAVALSAVFSDAAGSERLASFLINPADTLAEHGATSRLHTAVGQRLLQGMKHDEMLDVAYSEIFGALRTLCHHPCSELTLEASVALRSLMACNHELMDRAKAYVAQTNPSLFGCLEPYQRDGVIPVDTRAFFKRSHDSKFSSREPLGSSRLDLNAKSFGISAPHATQKTLLTNASLWALLPHKPESFLKAFVCAFAQHLNLDVKFDYLRVLLPVATLHAPFAELLWPVLFLHAIMLNETDTQRRSRTQWTSLLRDHLLKHAAACKSVARVFLNTLDTVRCAFTSALQIRGRRKRAAKQVAAVKTVAGIVPCVQTTPELWWLSDLTAVELAEAAQACDLSHTSLMYLELSCEGFLKNRPGLVAIAAASLQQFPVDGGDGSLASLIPPSAKDPPRRLRGVAHLEEEQAAIASQRRLLLAPLLNAACSLSDRDLQRVCRASQLLPGSEQQLLLRRSEGLMEWQQALQYGDHYLAARGRGDDGAAQPYHVGTAVQHLTRLGCPRSAMRWAEAAWRTSRVIPDEDSRLLRAAMAEAAWRTSQWDAPLHAAARDSQFGDGPQSYHEAVFAALNAVRVSDAAALRVAVRTAHIHLLPLLSHSATVVDALVRCQALREVVLFHSSARPNGVSSWLRRVSRSQMMQTDVLPYHRLELVDAVRHVLCKLSGDMHAWSTHISPSTARGVAGGMLAVADQRLTEFVTTVRDGPEATKLLVKLPTIALSRARILMEKEDAMSAIWTLQEAEATKDARLHAEVVRSIIQWAHDKQVVSTSTLVFDSGLHRIVGQPEQGGQSSFLMACLCDELIQEHQTRYQSPESAALRRSIQESIATQDDLKKQLDDIRLRPSATEADAARNKELRRALQLRIDHLQKDIKTFSSEQDRDAKNLALFRNSALHHYAKCLGESLSVASMGGVSARTSLALQAIFRLVDLWLSPPLGCDVNAEQDKTSVMKVPTSCFLPLLTQLASRLGPGVTPALRDIVVNVVVDFPFQTVWSLLALVNGDKWSAAESATHVSDAEKIKSATEVLTEVRKRSSPLQSIVKSAELLADALLELAFERPPSDKVTIPIPPKMKLMAMGQKFQRIPPPTVVVPVDRTCSARGYDMSGCNAPPTVVEYRAYYERMPGINVPKVIYCVTSRGTVEKQLLKSNDDMRQDAIIEQVFHLTNALQQSATASHKDRDLLLRTYSVVPLGPSTGVLQWVNATMPIGEYLIGSHSSDAADPGAHVRYYPDEPLSFECRERMDNKLPGATRESRIKTFKAILTEFTPAMHFFFYEHFANPHEWVARKNSYTNSVAAASMVGYLVGLGDRHLSNILIHKPTAEVVLIDLGIAFEQGKLLRMPELVPFRLTRDIVDGMGIHGVEGRFRFSCEAALRTLRNNKDMLGTILDAFLHDPLAKWAIDTNNNQQAGIAASSAASAPQQKVKTKQSTADADRALARVREKLRGYESGEVFSVEGHVQRLIQTATSDEHLALMFEGWAPWV